MVLSLFWLLNQKLFFQNEKADFITQQMIYLAKEVFSNSHF